MKKLSALLITGLCSLTLLTGCDSAKSESSKENANGSSENAVTEEDHKTSFGNLTNFSCETIDGGTFTADTLAEKDLTIINFWQTSCGPCVAEMPELEALRQTLPDNVQLILVSLDYYPHMERVKEVVADTGYTGTVAMLGDQDILRLSTNILYTPTTLFFDKDGMELGSEIVGASPDLTATYTDTINALLNDMGKEAVWNN